MNPEIETIIALLSRFRFYFSNESGLQDSIERALKEKGMCVAREVTLFKDSRIDFMVGNTGIEVKVDGSLSNLTRQVHRYLQSDRVSGMIVVTSKSTHTALAEEINGKPVRVLCLSGRNL